MNDHYHLPSLKLRLAFDFSNIFCLFYNSIHQIFSKFSVLHFSTLKFDCKFYFITFDDEFFGIFDFKIKNAKKFITKGDKVKFTVKFRGREMQHTDLGKDLMNRIIEETKDIAKIESKPKFEGRQMVMIIQPI